MLSNDFIGSDFVFVLISLGLLLLHNFLHRAPPNRPLLNDTLNEFINNGTQYGLCNGHDFEIPYCVYHWYGDLKYNYSCHLYAVVGC